MNTIKLKRMQKALLNKDSNQKEIIYRLSCLYINKECIDFCKMLLSDIKDVHQQELILLQLKALLRQLHRAPDMEIYEFYKPEFKQLFREIKDEQKACDPIKWLDAQLDLLRFNYNSSKPEAYTALLSSEGKRLLTADEVIQLCKISKSTLGRWIANGLNPIQPNGGRKRYFDQLEITEWQRQAS